MPESIAICLENVSKTFGRRNKRVDAVHQISLEVATGQVFGFLGPNGAGKSSTIRMIMDLIRPSGGSVKLFGQPVQGNYKLLRRVGALVEGAAFYEFLTGRKNLEILARTGDCYDPARIQSLLAQVGMADRADRKVQGYSTGMKQRLVCKNRQSSITTPSRLSSGSGNCGFISRSVWTMVRMMARLRYHFWLAGITCHEAHSVLHSRSISS